MTNDRNNLIAEINRLVFLLADHAKTRRAKRLIELMTKANMRLEKELNETKGIC